MQNGKENRNGKVVFCLRFSIVLVFIIGLIICGFWLPFRSLRMGASSQEISGRAFYWVQLVFYWCVSVPIFGVLFIGWGITDKVKTGKEFTDETAGKFALAAKLLFADSAVFLVGQTVLSFFKWDEFSLLFFIVGIFGLIAALVAYLISKYVKTASDIKEENDSIL